jgi:alcohol dehydrogenase (NADP+)
MNPFYRNTGWSKDIAHMTKPITENPILLGIGEKYGKTPIQIALAWGMNSGRSVIPKSTIDWQILQNIEADFELAVEDIEAIGGLDLKARFNDPSLDYQYRLYSDLEGIEGTKYGKTH